MIQDNETNSTINSIRNTLNDGDGSDSSQSPIEKNEKDSLNASAEQKPHERLNAEQKEEQKEESKEELNEKLKEKVSIEFPYSNLLRSKAPKAFDLAEKVATDWKNEGDFTDLGISHPVAGIVASQALQKAKSVEKKLEEKGVFSIAKMGFEIAKSQVENIKNKIQK